MQSLLRIKRFIGNSENAVKTQIWCTIATYVLYRSLFFEKTHLQQAFAGSDYVLEQTNLDNQLNLFDF